MVRGKRRVCRPRSNRLTIHTEREVRYAAAKIRVLNPNVEVPGFAGIRPLRGAGFLRRALIARHNLSAGGVFPRSDIDDLVSRKACIFSFEAVRIMSGAAECIRYAGFLQEVLHDGVAPDGGVAGLVFEPRSLVL